MQTTSQPQQPVLSRATFPAAVMRLAVATDAELAEWDARLPEAVKRHEAERGFAGLPYARQAS